MLKNNSPLPQLELISALAKRQGHQCSGASPKLEGMLSALDSLHKQAMQQERYLQEPIFAATTPRYHRTLRADYQHLAEKLLKNCQENPVALRVDLQQTPALLLMKIKSQNDATARLQCSLLTTNIAAAHQVLGKQQEQQPAKPGVLNFEAPASLFLSEQNEGRNLRNLLFSAYHDPRKQPEIITNHMFNKPFDWHYFGQRIGQIDSETLTSDLPQQIPSGMVLVELLGQQLLGKDSDDYQQIVKAYTHQVQVEATIAREELRSSSEPLAGSKTQGTVYDAIFTLADRLAIDPPALAASRQLNLPAAIDQGSLDPRALGEHLSRLVTADGLDAIQAILLQRDGRGQNAIHSLCQQGGVEALRTLFGVIEHTPAANAEQKTALVTALLTEKPNGSELKPYDIAANTEAAETIRQLLTTVAAAHHIDLSALSVDLGSDHMRPLAIKSPSMLVSSYRDLANLTLMEIYQFEPMTLMAKIKQQLQTQPERSPSSLQYEQLSTLEDTAKLYQSVKTGKASIDQFWDTVFPAEVLKKTVGAEAAADLKHTVKIASKGIDTDQFATLLDQEVGRQALSYIVQERMENIAAGINYQRIYTQRSLELNLDRQLENPIEELVDLYKKTGYLRIPITAAPVDKEGCGFVLTLERVKTDEGPRNLAVIYDARPDHGAKPRAYLGVELSKEHVKDIMISSCLPQLDDRFPEYKQQKALTLHELTATLANQPGVSPVDLSALTFDGLDKKNPAIKQAVQQPIQEQCPLIMHCLKVMDLSRGLASSQPANPRGPSALATHLLDQVRALVTTLNSDKALQSHQIVTEGRVVATLPENLSILAQEAGDISGDSLKALPHQRHNLGQILLLQQLLQDQGERAGQSSNQGHSQNQGHSPNLDGMLASLSLLKMQAEDKQANMAVAVNKFLALSLSEEDKWNCVNYSLQQELVIGLNNNTAIFSVNLNRQPAWLLLNQPNDQENVQVILLTPNLTEACQALDIGKKSAAGSISKTEKAPQSTSPGRLRFELPATFFEDDQPGKQLVDLVLSTSTVSTNEPNFSKPLFDFRHLGAEMRHLKTETFTTTLPQKDLPAGMLLMEMLIKERMPEQAGRQLFEAYTQSIHTKASQACAGMSEAMRKKPSYAPIVALADRLSDLFRIKVLQSG